MLVESINNLCHDPAEDFLLWKSRHESGDPFNEILTIERGRRRGKGKNEKES
jgi:hypothetical protein